MVIIGIDQSLTGTGVVVMLDGKVVFHCVIKSCKQDGCVYTRVFNLSTAIMEVVHKYKPDQAYIEGIAMGQANPYSLWD